MIKEASPETEKDQKSARQINKPASSKSTTPEKEFGGPKGKEPTRYGDWEKNGRCIDF
jgi:hypothetical protein